MQANKVKLGGDYAVRHEKKLKRFRVMTQTTVRDGTNTTNYFSGIIHNDDGTEHVEAKYEVSDILDEFTAYSELVERQKAEAKRKQDVENARIAKKQAVVNALTNWLGFEAVDFKKCEASGGYSYKQKLPIRPGYGGIEIDEDAYDVILSRLSPDWQKPVEREPGKIEMLAAVKGVDNG